MTKQTTISFVVGGPLARPDLPGLCDRLRDLIALHGATCVPVSALRCSSNCCSSFGDATATDASCTRPCYESRPDPSSHGGRGRHADRHRSRFDWQAAIR